MNRNRLAELIALTAVALGIVALAGWLMNSGKPTEASAVAANLAIVIQAIRGLGQSQAMQSMAEQLGQSQPVSAPLELNRLAPSPGDSM